MRLVAQSAGIRSISVSNPKIVRAVSVADEGDLGPIWRIARELLECHATSDPFGHATGNWQPIEIAEKVEDDHLAVRRHIERHPRSLVGSERDASRRFEGQAARSL